MVRYFVKILSCLKEYFPSETIRKLVISVSEKGGQSGECGQRSIKSDRGSEKTVL